MACETSVPMTDTGVDPSVGAADSAWSDFAVWLMIPAKKTRDLVDRFVSLSPVPPRNPPPLDDGLEDVVVEADVVAAAAVVSTEVAVATTSFPALMLELRSPVVRPRRAPRWFWGWWRRRAKGRWNSAGDEPRI